MTVSRVSKTVATRPTAADGSQTILRALSVLHALRDSSTDLGVTEIAKMVSLPSSTVHRILRTLVLTGYVVQSGETDRYRLGREAFLLGRAAGHTLGFDAALPVLERLAVATGESVNLVVRDGAEGIVVLRVESSQPLRFSQPVGSRIPLYCTSTGKALMAFSPDAEETVARLGPLQPRTSHTITSAKELLRELAGTRKRGFSVNHSERIPGVCGVAAPVLASSGLLIAALAIQGPEFRMPAERISELGPQAIETAREIVAVLPPGYRI